MKKITLLLSLLFVFINVFSQTLDFRENFENGVFINEWKITTGKWYIADLKDKGISPRQVIMISLLPVLAAVRSPWTYLFKKVTWKFPCN